MVKRKVDNRVRILIENGIASGHRSFFVVVGKKSRDQVIYLHHILSKTCLKQANVLWCYKHKLEFSSHRRKRIKQLKVKQRYGNVDLNEDDPFEMFVSMTEIRYCYYKETHKILGNTFKMCVLQDFESLTPNILCRTVETVEGGGVVIILLESMTSLKQLYTLNMDVHARYRTEAHQDIVPRFNERFILSLSSCRTCLVLDDELQVLPISSLTKEIEPIPFSHSNKVLTQEEEKLKELKDDFKDAKPLGTLLGLCKTLDQAVVVQEFISAITENTLSSTITLTAARGRGKSAAMGLSLAAAIYVGYSNMFVTSPSPENLNTFFEFLLKGLDALMYEKHIHYQTLTSTNPGHNKAIMRLTVKKDHKQYVQYISPQECEALENAELLVIDEAAAIPLPQVQALLGPYLVFLASTVSGYEGTGRSLSLKLIKELREKTKIKNVEDEDVSSNNPKRRKVENYSKSSRKLLELSLKESIRYKPGDPTEKWLYDLLCLESPHVQMNENVPSPEECNLFYVNRDMLFCYHKMTEKFLNNVMSLLVASHYRNTPDDLQTLSDAPAHHLFVLIPPTDPNVASPKPLCVIQVAYEGKISKVSLQSSASFAGKKPSGDMIPWTINNFYDDEDFPQFSGARIVRIATHPDLQGQGYGSRALKLLEVYYSRAALKEFNDDIVLPENKATFNCIQDEEVANLAESLEDGKKKPSQPLLLSTLEREPEPLHYLGVAFGASFPLIRFWKKAGFSCVYLSQSRNLQTGEYSTIFMKVLNEPKSERGSSWLGSICFQFKDVVTRLLQHKSFRSFDTMFALSFISNRIYKRTPTDSEVDDLKTVISERGLKELDRYLRHDRDFSHVSHLVERISLLYYDDKIALPNKVKPLHQAILVGVGLQMKTPSVVANELDISVSELLSELYATISDFYEYFKSRYHENGK